MNRENSLSVIIIAKNEAPRIVECLKAVSWADEILVVDNDSSDQTMSLAKQHKARVLEEKNGSFSDLRNKGLREVRYPWIFYVDADELVLPDLRREIVTLIQKPEARHFTYSLKRVNYFLGSRWPYQDRMERLFWRSNLTGWHGELHETPDFTGPVRILQHELYHYTHRSLAEMVSKTNEWSAIEAKLRLFAHHPNVVTWRLWRVMLTGFSEYFFRQGGWRVGTVGWIESIYQAFSLFITYAKLWELQEQQDRGIK